jgi:predicted acyltransferase
MAQASAAALPAGSTERQGERLAALDAFRGAIMALMVLVNNPGSGRDVYPPLNHAEWHGWTITDVVFPSFLWIVGVAMTLSLARRVAAGVPRDRLFAQVVRRAAILYVLGLVSYLFPRFDFSTMRVMGVLQRIAICYLIAAAIYLTAGVRGQLLCIAALLAAYWLIMRFAPVPGYGSGHLDVERNFAHYVDRIVLGVHNYAPTRTWDPEGIVSTLPAIATTLLGIMAGHLLGLRKPLAERTTWLFLAGNLLIALGLICDTWLPINKKLWTSSFALFMGGLDFVMFAMFLWVVDGLGYRRGVKPLGILGRNAITIYLISELLDATLGSIRWTSAAGRISLHGWLYQHLFAPLASPVNASLLWAIAYTMCMWAIAYAMYRRNWFLRV